MAVLKSLVRQRFDANLFDLTQKRFQKYIDTELHQHVTFALWALHAHVFQKFEHTPRLVLQSPTHESGKSAVLNILRCITPHNPDVLTDPTPATLFRLMGEKTPVLFDEGDNTRIDRQMLAILNKGFERGGVVPRTIKGEVEKFPVFCPVAIARIARLGAGLPPALSSRSIVARIFRQDPDANIERLSLTNISHMQDLAFIKELAEDWAAKVNLNPDPIMPNSFKGRNADKWRGMFSIGDSLDRGDIVREAAKKFEHTELSVYECLLIDIRKVFDAKNVNIILTKELVKALVELEDYEYNWAEYNKGSPLTANLLARTLNNSFGITPQVIWLPEGVHRSQQTGSKYYLRKDFEEMWRRYAPQPA